MKYGLLKAFALLVLLVVYLLFTFTLVVAYYNGGYVVLSINKYEEGLAEIIMLLAFLPLILYVVLREIGVLKKNTARKA